LGETRIGKISLYILTTFLKIICLTIRDIRKKEMTDRNTKNIKSGKIIFFIEISKKKVLNKKSEIAKKEANAKVNIL
jgi:D-alanine-D-alanine ligase-like ATP-grasp enzyme